jgi:hypothetical protein
MSGPVADFWAQVAPFLPPHGEGGGEANGVDWGWGSGMGRSDGDGTGHGKEFITKPETAGRAA